MSLYISTGLIYWLSCFQVQVFHILKYLNETAEGSYQEVGVGGHQHTCDNLFYIPCCNPDGKLGSMLTICIDPMAPSLKRRCQPAPSHQHWGHWANASSRVSPRALAQGYTVLLECQMNSAAARVVLGGREGGAWQGVGGSRAVPVWAGCWCWDAVTSKPLSPGHVVSLALHLLDPPRGKGRTGPCPGKAPECWIQCRAVAFLF